MFDLEEFIRRWRKSLYSDPHLEDGAIEELESHLRDEIDRLMEEGEDDETAFQKAAAGLGEGAPIGREFNKTDRRFLAPSEPLRSSRFSPGLGVNYLKIAIRRLIRQKGYALINITGLAVGIACCLFILRYVRFELSFDRFLPASDRTFLVGQDSRSENGRRLVASNMPLVAPTLRERFSQVEAAGRINQGWIDQVRYRDRIYREESLWTADSGALDVLSISFLKGDPKTALERPHTAVLSRRMAEKYFGSEDPIGKLIEIGDDEYEINGVLENPPRNTDLPYKIIMSWKSIEDEEHWTQWRVGMSATACLVRLRPGASPESFEAEIRDLPREFCSEEMKEMGTDLKFFLMGIRDFHRVSLGGEKPVPSSAMVYVWIFSAVGALILLIACMNYMNLATARSSVRAPEVGMRKVVGAKRGQLVRQFLGESFLTAAVSLILATGLVQILLPAFNRLARTEFSSRDFLRLDILLGETAVLLIVGLAAGCYPAFVLSAFRPIAVLRGKWKSGAPGSFLRRALVVGQFGISIALIIATLIISRQISFMKSRPLGFAKERKLVIQLEGWRQITDNYQAVKAEFLRIPSVLDITASSGFPGSMINRTWVYPKGQENTNGAPFRSLRCDHDFTRVYGLELVAGRFFDRSIASDTHEAFLLNQAGVKAFGWASPEDAIGKQLWDRGYPVVGVVKDFHWWGLQRPIEPMIMRVVPELFRSLTLTIGTADIEGTLKSLEKIHARLFPGDMFEYYFVDAHFDLQYRAEERIGRIFRIFTCLGIFIACLGLFGLASFIAEQRTKELGIRKVLGAPISRLVLLLSGDFARWVLAANLIAWPLAYFAGRRWLENFAYRANPGLELFVAASLTALGIALASVGFQAFRAAAADPVKSLRYE